MIMYTDKETVERLRKTFDLNYKITKLYSIYLEHYPELITPEMINELCSDGRISKKEAITAIICEAFGLDDSRGGDERRLIREYVRPSIRLLDAKRYTENAYYKNIKNRVHKHPYNFNSISYYFLHILLVSYTHLDSTKAIFLHPYSYLVFYLHYQV